MERVEIQQLRQLDINASISGEFRVVDSKTAECSRRRFRNARGKDNDAMSNAKKNDQLDGVVDAFLFRGGAASAHFVDVLCSYDVFQHADTVAWIATRYLNARRGRPSPSSIQSSSLSQSPVSTLVTALCASLAYVFPAGAVPTCAMITAPQAPTRFYCTIGEVSLVLHHWATILGLQHGAPAALYERFFDRLLELMSTGHAASHAALCCSSAKGLAFLWLAVHNKRRTSDSGQFTVAAASALNVPLRKLETFAVTLREDLGMQEEFFTWAIRRWLHVVEIHVNLFAASVAVDEGRGPRAVSQTFVVSVVSDQHHRHSHSSEPLTSPQFKNAALFSELLAPSAVDSLQSMLWGDMSDSDHQHETNAGRVWALLHAMRRHHCSAATPSSRVILIGLGVSDPAVSWIFPHKCVPWAAPMLPREFTKLAECAAIMSVAQTKDSRADMNEMDDDEMGPLSFSQDRFFQPWMLLSSSTVTKKASRHYFDYAQMSPASKVRVLLMGLGVRYLETSAAPGASPHDSVAGGASAAADELDVVVDGRTSVVTWLNPEVLSFVHTAADTTKSLILAPTIQAAARAYLSAHHFVARKHRSRMRHHVVIVQGFIRALSSMRHTCHKDVFQRIASMSFADSLSGWSWLLQPDVARVEELRSTLPNLDSCSASELYPPLKVMKSRAAREGVARGYIAQRLIGLESLEHRARCLVSEEHHRVWQSMTTGMFLRSPLWGLMYRQRIHRDLLTDSEIMHTRVIQRELLWRNALSEVQ
ncbi:Hypothetical protein, putative [Bodo saltans]|uniref:Uncharacterized protein n=1 Tax=Bodo saltans TaxID=75058 RepID=A0A0S4IVZ3_BODSA|nr:Hypothetical protein, putative [Bodo saltans]|eukprot:CUG05862.1 Hypothetical protein, putative [Bodo saltans]